MFFLVRPRDEIILFPCWVDIIEYPGVLRHPVDIVVCSYRIAGEKAFHGGFDRIDSPGVIDEVVMKSNICRGGVILIEEDMGCSVLVRACIIAPSMPLIDCCKTDSCERPRLRFPPRSPNPGHCSQTRCHEQEYPFRIRYRPEW